ncbi:LysR family transcriptional regulator [Roseovarius nitratireducens]|uniref:LysR family transcriptional regulator n=1 Tax=Roseovarius nitratireducens TaxID=2044597 RepID=UPI000CE1A4FB|nr:LysR family transcriptional regulator [Roseovarius nitratireducens]
MNLQQLAVFREIMNTGSLSAAARNLHRTQPAISAALKALEASLGMELFHREGRRLSPVPEARYLLSEAEEILDRVSATRSNLAGMRDRVRGTLRIVTMPGPSAFLMPQFVSRFIGDARDIRVTLSTRSSPQILNLIAAQSFDIGFCDMGTRSETEDRWQSELFSELVTTCTCLCALPADHPLADRGTVTAENLDGEPMGALQPGHVTVRDTQRAFDACGAEFNLCVDAQYFVPLFHFIEAGQICAVVDPLSAESYLRLRGENASVKFKRFEPSVPFAYSLITPQQRRPSLLAQEFAAQWHNYVRQILETPLMTSD